MRASNSLCMSPKQVASDKPSRAIQDVNHCRVGVESRVLCMVT